MAALKRAPFDSLCLAAVAAELQAFVGSKIQRVLQVTDTSLSLGLYPAGQAEGKREQPLLINWHADFARVHLLSGRPPTIDLSHFGSLLRKFVGGGRIAFIRQRGLDRILDIGILAAEGDFQLSIELMGRHSNAILIDHNLRILASAKTVGPRQSKRPVRPGATYQPPPFEPKPSLLEAAPTDSLADFEGVSPFLRRLLEAGMPLSDVQDSLRKSEFAPQLSRTLGAYPLNVSLLVSDAVPQTSISRALEISWSEREQSAALESAQRSLIAQLQRVVDARTAAVEALSGALDLADRAAELQQEGELILAYQHQIGQSAESVELYDYQGELRTLKLDPEKGAVENANVRFQRARHAKERRGEVEEQHDRLRNDLAAAEALLIAVQRADQLAVVEQLREEAAKRKWLHAAGTAGAKEDRPFEGHAVRELLSPSGYRVLYGTNATSNDYITTRVAKGNDWWFHVRGQTSAHVILVTGGKPDKIQMRDIEFAAKVSARNSVAKHSTHVPVDYTLKKYVRKPRGSAPGLAVYEREKTIHVDP